MRILLRAANSRQYLTRQAAVRELYVSNAVPVPGGVAFTTWLRLFESRYPDTRELAWRVIASLSPSELKAIPGKQLFHAYRLALGSPDLEIRRNAWVTLTVGLARPDGFPYRFASRIPELLALGEGDRDLQSAFARWLPYGLGATTLGMVSVGSERRFAMTLYPSQQYAHPEYFAEIARAVATSPNVDASVQSSPGPKGPWVKLECTYHARGPVGVHRVRVNLLSTQGRVVGVVDIKAEEIPRR